MYSSENDLTGGVGVGVGVGVAVTGVAVGGVGAAVGIGTGVAVFVGVGVNVGIGVAVATAGTGVEIGIDGSHGDHICVDTGVGSIVGLGGMSSAVQPLRTNSRVFANRKSSLFIGGGSSSAAA